MIIRRPRRGKRPAKRLDLADMREVLRDRRYLTTLAIVAKHDGQRSHFELIQEGGKAVDVMVDVVTVPDELELSCRLAVPAGGAGYGIWRIPSEGAEVKVSIPDGRLDFMPTVTAIYSTGEVPEELAEHMTLIAAPDLVVVSAPEVRLGSSAASDPVALKSDLQALKDAVSNAAVSPNDGGASFKSSLLAALAQWPVASKKVKAE